MIRTKMCHLCGRTQRYAWYQSWWKAMAENKPCRSCAAKVYSKRPENMHRIGEIGKNNIGSKNPFFGKKHSEETIERLRKEGMRTQKLRKETRNNYNIWLDRYGKEEADSRMASFKNKASINSSGVRNPMFGKPSPNGSGCGWKGWYKGWYFRSLRELSFMIKEIEEKGRKWRSAECKDLSIPYVLYDGSARTYRADFILDEKEMIEIKPARLHDSPLVKIKKDAAVVFCNKMNLTYSLVDIEILPTQYIQELRDRGDLVFSKRYSLKFDNFLKTNVK